MMFDHLRETLAAARAQGAPFAVAWSRAVRQCGADPAWREALEGTRSAWERVYLDAPKRVDDAISLLGEEREPLALPSDGEDVCELEGCENVLPRKRSSRTRYCCEAHREQARRARERAHRLEHAL